LSIKKLKRQNYHLGFQKKKVPNQVSKTV